MALSARPNQTVARPNQTVAREGGERAAWDSEVMLSRGVVKASNDG